MTFRSSQKLRRCAAALALAAAAALLGPALASAADFDGDGRTDRTVFRPATPAWHILHSSTGNDATITFGLGGDKPVPGDYDGDKRTDIAVWRPSTATWWVLRSSDDHAIAVQWGLGGDKPVPGDYDGDNRTDFAVWRPSTGEWWVLRSSDNTHSVTPEFRSWWARGSAESARDVWRFGTLCSLCVCAHARGRARRGRRRAVGRG